MAKKNDFYKNFSNRKSYNNAPLKAGEVLVPVAMTREDWKKNNVIFNNLEIWRFGRKSVLVAFAPVQADKFSSAMNIFNNDVQRILNPQEEKINDLSLDKMTEDLEVGEKDSYDPTGTTELEDVYFLEIAIRDLIQYYYDHAEPKKGMVINLLWEGYSKADVAEQVIPNLKKRCAYKFISQTQKEGLKLLNTKFRI